MPVSRPVLAMITILVIALGCFTLGTYFGARLATEGDGRIDALRAEMTAMLKHRAERVSPMGTSGQSAAPAARPDLQRDNLIADVKRQLQREMGLLPLDLLKSRRESFVELYSYDNRGGSSYGTAGYLGDGYFITVKHGVLALDPKASDTGREPREIVSVKLMLKGKAVPATVIDSGDAQAEVDPGDWAIVKVKDKVDMPPLRVDLAFTYEFADPIFRLGNDYSKGIILSTGYVGQRTANALVTCLTDGHPGVSGGGVLDREGNLVGIPVGRMQGDYRFSFILPLREEMFQKVPSVQLVVPPSTLTIAPVEP